LLAKKRVARYSAKTKAAKAKAFSLEKNNSDAELVAVLAYASYYLAQAVLKDRTKLEEASDSKF
jgi:hypothetical protein